jgi:hypothetical protein
MELIRSLLLLAEAKKVKAPEHTLLLFYHPLTKQLALDGWYEGQLVDTTESVDKLTLFHGSDNIFTEFRGRDTFLTPDIHGAVLFGAGYIKPKPFKPEKSVYQLYVCHVDRSKVEEFDHQSAYKAGLIHNNGQPYDAMCFDWIEKHPETTAIRLKGISDGGVREVWYVNDPKKIEIKKRIPYIIVKGEVPKEEPTKLKADDHYDGGVGYSL